MMRALSTLLCTFTFLLAGCSGGSGTPPDASIPDAVPDATADPCYRMPAGTPCGDPTDNDCNHADSCLNGFCLPNIQAEGTECNDQTQNECDQPDTCDRDGNCLSNYIAENTPCGDPSQSECTAPDLCNATGICERNDQSDGLACDDCLDGPGMCTVCMAGDCWNVCMPEVLTTTYAADNAQHGAMFDVRALRTLEIRSFEVNLEPGTHDLEIYYRTDLYSGFEGDPNAWTLIGAANGVVSNGSGVPTAIPIVVDIVIPEGEYHSFYVTTTGGTLIEYTDGTAEGNLFANDENLEFYEGIGKEYPFFQNYRPRVFNGTILYDEPPCLQ